MQESNPRTLIFVLKQLFKLWDAHLWERAAARALRSGRLYEAETALARAREIKNS